jgi:hypothetical protein
VRALSAACGWAILLVAVFLGSEESRALNPPRLNVELVSRDIPKIPKDRWSHDMRLGMLGEDYINKSSFSGLFRERKLIFYESNCHDLQDFPLDPFGLRSAYFSSGDNYCGIDGYFLFRKNRMPKLARNSSVLSDLGHKQSLQSGIVLAGRTLQHSTYMRPNEYGRSAPSILQCAGYRDDGGAIASILKISSNPEFGRNPRTLCGYQKIAINFVGFFRSDGVSSRGIGTSLSGFRGIVGGIHRSIHMASMNQGDAPKPISGDPQRQSKESNEYGRDGPQPFGGYLGEHRNPLKDDAIFGGAFIIGGVIFCVLMAFGIRELIAGRDEDRYLIDDREEQKECAEDERDPTKSKSSAKPR